MKFTKIKIASVCMLLLAFISLSMMMNSLLIHKDILSSIAFSFTGFMCYKAGMQFFNEEDANVGRCEE